MNNHIYTLYHLDDDARELEYCKQLFYGLDNILYLGGTTSIETALDFVKIKRPDIFLLDIEMPEKTGIEVAKMTAPFCKNIIFLTSHSEYSLAAFDCFALSYLLKPLTVEAVNKVISRLDGYRAQLLDNQMAQIAELINMKNNHLTQRIFINNQKQISILQINEIVYLEAKGAYTQFVTFSNVTHTSSKLLKTYTSLLETNPDFIRIHRSYVINKRFITGIEKKHTQVKISFSNGAFIEIGKFKKDIWYDQLLE